MRRRRGAYGMKAHKAQRLVRQKGTKVREVGKVRKDEGT